MLWDDIVKNIIGKKTVLDKVKISTYEEIQSEIPPLIKASVLLTDKLLSSNDRIVLVFPEQKLCSYYYVVARTLLHIAEGKIKKDYDPRRFIPGEKLKFNNKVMQFVGIEVDEKDKIERIFVRFNDGIKYGIPIETAPFLQHVQSLRLSTYQSFSKEFAQLKALTADSKRSLIQQLANFKTHLDDTSVLVAPIQSTKDLFLNTLINDEKLSDILLLAQADLDGKLKNMTSGQLSGNPAIVLTQDLYAVNQIIETGLVVNNVFIEASQSMIENQLDALDKLIKNGTNLFILSDLMNYNDYKALETRGFNIWTWNEKTITSELFGEYKSSIDIRAKNVAQRKISFIDVSCHALSTAITLLYSNKKVMDAQSNAMIQIFQELFEVAMYALRTVWPLDNHAHLNEILVKCKSNLSKEQSFISNEMYHELDQVVDILLNVCNVGYELPKVAEMARIAEEIDADKLIIIIPQKSNRNEAEQYLKTLYFRKDLEILVVHPNQYLSLKAVDNSMTIISCWLNRSLMSKLLNANVTSHINVLLYEIEKRWKDGYVKYSNELEKRYNALNSKIKLKIDGNVAIDEHEHEKTLGVDNLELEESELESIELTLSNNKYRKYITNTTKADVIAFPVSFVGDLIAFYRSSHRLLTATKLIYNDFDQIEEIKPDAVQIGDFIIEPETQHDLIKEMADVILNNSGYTDLRKTARKWKEALEVESIFSDEETITEKLQEAGCGRSKITISYWLNSDDMISPKSKEDITYIAKATDDFVLLEMVDIVFEAGRIVKNAHVQAGHYLAEKLKSNLLKALIDLGGTDGFNIWEPIEIEIENVGMVKILKVIDVGRAIYIESTSTNRLIDTNRTSIFHGG